jgi:hypothetical protein
MSGTAYRILLCTTAIVTWILLWISGITQYDTNYVFFLIAVLISGLGTISVGVMFLAERAIVMDNRLLSFVFILSSSPLSLIIFVFFYSEVFGSFFNI